MIQVYIGNEYYVNSFLEDKKDSIDVIDVKLSCNSEGSEVVMVVYSTKEGQNG